MVVFNTGAYNNELNAEYIPEIVLSGRGGIGIQVNLFSS